MSDRFRNTLVAALALLLTGGKALAMDNPAAHRDSLTAHRDSLAAPATVATPNRDSLLDRLEHAVVTKIAARQVENQRRIRLGLAPDYVIRIGDADMTGPTDFPTNVYPLTQQNTAEADVEKLWDFSGNTVLQPIPQQLQQWSQAQGYDYYVIVCAIYNYFRLDEETKFNNITWDSVGTLSSSKSKSGSATSATSGSTSASSAAATASESSTSLSSPGSASATSGGGAHPANGGYSNLFNYLVNKFKTDASIPKSSRPAIYHFVISAYVPYQGATDNAPSGKLRHFQGLYWFSPNGNPQYDSVFHVFYTSLQAELASPKSAKASSKEDWLAAFISANQQMISGIRSINETSLMACTSADSISQMLASIPVQVFGGFSSPLRIHILQVLAGDEIPEPRESLVCSLIEQTPASQADDLLTALRAADPYTPAQIIDITVTDPASGGGVVNTIANPKYGACLLECVTEELNDKFLGIWGGDNYHRLILGLTAMCYKAPSFLQQVKQLNDAYSDSATDKIPDRLIVYTYNSLWNKIALTFMNASYVSIPAIDWSVSYINNCQLAITKQLFLTYLTSPAPISTTPLDPFAPIVFENNSDLGLLTDLNTTPSNDYVVPAIVMKYADEKATDETLTAAVMATIDVASLATGYGELQAGITGARKAWVLFDMVNAGINLTVNVANYDNNPTVKQILGYYNLITGGISVTRMATGAVRSIYNGIKTQQTVLTALQIRQFLASVKGGGTDLAALSAEDMTTMQSFVTRLQAEANARGLTNVAQEATDALTALNNASMAWIDALGLTADVKAALKADIQASQALTTVFAGANPALKGQLAEAYALLRTNSANNLTAANALFRNPAALTALASIRNNPALATYQITDNMLAEMQGWGNSVVQISYDQVIGNLDNFLTFLTRQNVTCNNCSWLWNRFLQTSASGSGIANNMQSAYWTMEDIASDVTTFGNKTIQVEYPLANGVGRIDVAIEGNNLTWVEFKWYTSSTIDQNVFVTQFVNRDLANLEGGLENLQWRIKGNKLTIATVRSYLASAAGQTALNNANIIRLFNDYAGPQGFVIANINDLNTFINGQDNWFTLIFK
jgi:hypothetical protein